MKKVKAIREIDFNKLIKDIISAAKEDPNIYATNEAYQGDRSELVTTLKLEVTVSKDSARPYGDTQKSSKRLVLLTINDA